MSVPLISCAHCPLDGQYNSHRRRASVGVFSLRAATHEFPQSPRDFLRFWILSCLVFFDPTCVFFVAFSEVITNQWSSRLHFGGLVSVVSPKCQRKCGERLRIVLGCGAVFRISRHRMQGDAVDPEEDQTFSLKRPPRDGSGTVIIFPVFRKVCQRARAP